MTVTLHTWWFPLVITLVAWGVVVFRPVKRRRGDYDFGPELQSITELVCAVVITLAAWLVWALLT